MDEFERSDLEKDSHNTFYQNAIHCKERDNAPIKKCGILSLVFVIKPGRHMIEIFSVGLQKTDEGLKA